MERTKERKTGYVDSRRIEQFYDYLRTTLKKGRVKGLGIFEYIWLCIVGWKDGKRGYPVRGEDGEWTSAFIEKERNMNNESCDRLYGCLQIEMRECFVQCSNLVDELKSLDENMDEVNAGITRMTQKDISHMNAEERVHEAHRRRRVRRLGNELQKNLRAKYKQLIDVKNYIENHEKTVTLVVDRILNHSKQRIDVYYRMALRKHQERSGMPPYLRPFSTPDAVNTYMDNQAKLKKDIDDLLNHINHKYPNIRPKEVKADEERSR